MMTSPRFVVYVTWLFLWKMAHATDLRQERGFASVNVGDNMTLQCVYQSNVKPWLYWYKQMLGKQPKLIATVHPFSTNATFHDDFKNNPRFTLDTKKEDRNDLTIFYVKFSDSATYYCAYSTLFVLTFAEGTVVSVQGSSTNIPALLHQSPSETIQPGGSVTLNCTVQTGTCDGQHSVYWFKDSEESHPALIYTDGGSTDQCERKSNTTQRCDYNLPMESLNLSHAGTYYCAVASCGHILFGNRTKLDFVDTGDHLLLVYLLSGALVFTTILVVLLFFLVYKLNKKKSCQCSESHRIVSAPSRGNTEGYQNAQSPHYAALNLNVPNASRRQKINTDVECVYSGINQ
ncbi:uncharacterized protein LOC119222264 [Pungitius pungitius]|uniref:uncharacterized protein LOC119222264 n=1 Tax=Pungitius pungitius TaxID=134920 RepID=UPI002E0DCB8D